VNRRLLYILGAVAVVLAIRWYLRMNAATNGAASAAASTPSLLNWKLPWEVANTEETALASAIAAAQRNIRGFTPGTVTPEP
jgi:hypothetical protein